MSKCNKLVVFQDKKIRRVWHNDEWYFSVVDVVSTLINKSYKKSRKYWNKLAQRLREGGSEVVTKCHLLKLIVKDGKLKLIDCVNTEVLNTTVYI